MGNDVTIRLSDNPNFNFKKWERLKIASSGQESIIIRIKKGVNDTNTTLYPYEKQDNKFAQFIWWHLLKLLVFLRII